MEFDDNPTLAAAEAFIREYCGNIWAFLNTGKIQIKPKDYMTAYNMVVKLADENNQSEDVYQLYKRILDSDLQRLSGNIGVHSVDHQFLNEYVKQWKNYTVFSYTFIKIMAYLDRFHLKNQGDESLTQTCLNHFKSNIFDTRLTQLRGAILAEIRKDREGETVDLNLVKRAIDQFIFMGYDGKTIKIQRKEATEHDWLGEKNLLIYDKEFEKYLKESTTGFYRQMSKKWRNEMSCYEYILKVHQHLTKEETNSDQLLQVQTKPAIIKIVLTECVESFAQQITEMNQGCKEMFIERKVKRDELKLLYNVFNRVDTTLKFIIEKMDPYIQSEGEKIVLSEDLKTKPLEMVQKLLDFKNEIDELIAYSFDNDMRFQKASHQAFQTFMNKFDKTPQYIALFFDNCQKSTFKQKPMDEIEKDIEQIIKLFGCLHGRDEFIQAYAILLANRLLNKLSASDEAEEKVIKQLQVECGLNIVSKIKTMFGDIGKCKQLFADFEKGRPDGNNVQGIEFNAQVLTSGHWPFQIPTKMQLPSVMGNAQLTFNNFYQKKFSNRQLMWLYDKGSVVLQSSYLEKPYRFELNIVQACILMHFNDKDTSTTKDICNSLQIDRATYIAAMKTNLCRPKVGIIQNKSGKPKFDDDNEEIFVNMKYVNKLIQASFIPKMTAEQMVKDKSNAGVLQQVDEQVMKERNHVIEAITVRIMKAAKKDKYNNLIKNIIDQVKNFKADVKMIHQRIESLTEREFLERDEKDPTVIIYKP